MLSKKVIASHVTNLTDARYFAARGVDFLLFDMSLIALHQVIDIKEWVEGPKILLLFDNESLSFVDEAIIRLSPSGISGKSAGVITEMMHLSAYAEIFQWSGEKIKYDSVLYKAVSSLTEIQEMAEEEGVILYGGNESSPGVKAYDVLDDILDILDGPE